MIFLLRFWQGRSRKMPRWFASTEYCPLLVMGIDYQGTVLLNSRAVRLLSYVEDMSGNEKVRTIQSKELWLAEDMTFYVVSCMSTITMDKEEAICLNEHRSVVTTVECEDDIFFDMGSLICELDDICLFELLADADATIYEL